MPPLRIALAGLGTVGAGTLRLLQQNADLIASHAGRPVEVVAACAKDRSKASDLALDKIRWLDDPRDLAKQPDVEAVVELMGGAEGITRELVEAALLNGKHVVTANKALLAAHGAKLAGMAETKNVQLKFEAAVAGGIPIIKTLRESLAGNKMLSVQGILNGTCNYILTRMNSAKLDFAAALKEAQEKGYAEADPAMDVDGHDTAHKLALLAALAFGTKPDLKAVTTEGIRRIAPVDLHFAAELKCRVKLLGVARLSEHGLEQRVGPCLVPESSPLAQVDDVLNAVMVQGDFIGDVTLIGRGAGSAPTASAVVGDIMDLARGNVLLPFIVPVGSLRDAVSTPPEKRLSGWYIRLQVADRPGVVAEISAILRDEAISIESFLQHGHPHDNAVPVVITTHEVAESALRRATAKIASLEVVREELCLLRIESL